MTELKGEVFDIGYQPYEGVREGRNEARKAVMIDGMRTSLGIGRSLVTKAIPGILFMALFITALVFIIINQVTANDIGFAGPRVADFFIWTTIPLLIFSAIVAPELLTADRRSGVINLYLVRPITSLDYVVGRWLAYFLLSLFIIWFFQIVVFIGANSAGSDAWGQFRANWLEIPRFLASGATMALFITTLPMAAAAFTQRQSVAAAFVIGTLAILSPIGWTLSSQIEGAAGPWLALIDVAAMPLHINDLIFNRPFAGASAVAGQGAAKWAAIGIYLVLIAAPAALLWSKYRKASV
jgi:ABC-2 type transport system permease protein